MEETILLNPGQIVDDQYEISSFHSRGVISLVYRARDLYLGRDILLKQFRPPVEDTGGVYAGLFKKEAQLLKSLSHRAVPRIFDYFSCSFGTFQAVEFIEGLSLEKILRDKGSLPLNRVLSAGRQLLELLVYLHGKNPPLIHRSILPDHLMLNLNNLYLVNFSGASSPGPDEEKAFTEDISQAASVIHRAITGMDPRSLTPGSPLPTLKETDPKIPAELSDLIDDALNRNLPPGPRTASDFLTRLNVACSIIGEGRKCRRCGHLEPAASLFCCRCGIPAGDFPAVRETGLKIDFKPLNKELLEKSRLSSGLLLPFSLYTSRLLGFENLITIEHNRIEEFPHQVAAVRRALKDMGGSCILADEVGLGKTIEGGIIMAELSARGLTRSVLAVVPSHLRFQWQQELKTKFDEDFRIITGSFKGDLNREDRVIVSMAQVGRKGPLREKLLSRQWDMVIVDEAHHARNHRTLRWSFLNGLKRNYMLLLTATPVQNKLSDLFSLVTLLRPGHLADLKSFRREFIDPKNPRTPKNPEKMKELMNRVMIRTRRSDAYIKFPRRSAITRLVELNPRERELFDRTSDFITKIGRQDSSRIPFGFMQLFQRLTSSPRAAEITLLNFSQNEKLFTPEERSIWHELYLLAKDAGEPAKADALLEIAGNVRDKAVVFTSHLPTMEFLSELLSSAGFKTAVYRGTPGEKRQALDEFQRDARVLLACQSGGEGLNLQYFSNILINYDLPWNPMALEQRIGRLQRLGQTRDVFVFNIAAKDTIEAYILQVLEEKIKMFELSVGQLDLILGARIAQWGTFESLIWSKLNDSGEKSFQERILSVGDELKENVDEFEMAEESAESLNRILENPAGLQEESVL